MLTEQWVFDGGSGCYLGPDGAMVTNRALKLGSDGRLCPAGAYYGRLKEVPAEYRPHLDNLIAKGLLKGRAGSGEELELDLSEEAVRLLVIWDRSMSPASPVSGGSSSAKSTAP